MELRRYGVIAAALAMAFIVGRWSADESPAPAKAKAKTKQVGTVKVKQTGVTVQQLQEVLAKSKHVTGIQRQEALRNYMDKQVRWKGELISAYSSGGQLCAVISHRIKPSWVLGQRQVQVTVKFPGSQKEPLLKAEKGFLVTYQGILSEYTGSAKRPWLLRDGQIICVQAPQPKVGTNPATDG